MTLVRAVVLWGLAAVLVARASLALGAKRGDERQLNHAHAHRLQRRSEHEYPFAKLSFEEDDDTFDWRQVGGFTAQCVCQTLGKPPWTRVEDQMELEDDASKLEDAIMVRERLFKPQLDAAFNNEKLRRDCERTMRADKVRRHQQKTLGTRPITKLDIWAATSYLLVFEFELLKCVCYDDWLNPLHEFFDARERCEAEAAHQATRATAPIREEAERLKRAGQAPPLTADGEVVPYIPPPASYASTRSAAARLSPQQQQQRRPRIGTAAAVAGGRQRRRPSVSATAMLADGGARLTSWPRQARAALDARAAYHKLRTLPDTAGQRFSAAVQVGARVVVANAAGGGKHGGSRPVSKAPGINVQPYLGGGSNGVGVGLPGGTPVRRF